MYGPNMVINHNGLRIKLRPFSKDDIQELVSYFSSIKTHLNTNGLFGQTLENELEWYEKNRKDPDSCIWAIQPDGCDQAIGTTGLHHLSGYDNACSSGIIVWRQDWWGKGVASAAHLGRTLFAADYLNRHLIRSSVRTQNPASHKALLRVGYTVWGIEPRSGKRAGKWLDTYNLIWIHPEMVDFLYPEGIPEMYVEGVAKATIALEIARRDVDFP